MQTLSTAKSKNFLPLLVPYSLITLFFVEPLSSSAKSVVITLAVIAILLTPLRQQLGSIFRQSWAKLAASLFLLAVMACLWSPATLGEKMLIVEKYSKFLYLPILALGFQERQTRVQALHAFLLGMLLTCLISVLKSWHLVAVGPADADAVFRNHIMTGIMMSFAAYLSVFYFFTGQRKYRFAYALLFLLFSYQVLFISSGRTGYIIYLLLMVALMPQLFSFRKALVAIAIVCTFFAACFELSPTMKSGLSLVRSEIHYYNVYKDTSVGYRLQFHEFARNLFRQHPLLGNGTAAFTHEYNEVKPIKSWQRRLLEPHSQYWLIAVEFGVLGLLLFAAFYLSLGSAILHLKEFRPVAIAILLIFIIGGYSDSLLFYSGTGYFFVAFMALCLGSNLAERIDRSANDLGLGGNVHSQLERG